MATAGASDAEVTLVTRRPTLLSIRSLPRKGPAWKIAPLGLGRSATTSADHRTPSEQLFPLPRLQRSATDPLSRFAHLTACMATAAGVCRSLLISPSTSVMGALLWFHWSTRRDREPRELELRTQPPAARRRKLVSTDVGGGAPHPTRVLMLCSRAAAYSL